MLSGVSLANHAGYSAGSNMAASVIQNSVKTALVLSTLASMMPAAEAANMKGRDIKPVNGLIISLPCYAACLLTGAAAPLCIAFCTLLP